MKRAIIAIDPGKSGGIASYDGNQILHLKTCPKTVSEMSTIYNNIIVDLTINKYQIFTLIELVHAFPSDGRSSLAKFMINYGEWRGIITSESLSEPFTINPATWMDYYSKNRPKNKTERKRYLKLLALKLFPENKITLKTADAVLIAKYGFEGYKWDLE